MSTITSQSEQLFFTIENLKILCAAVITDADNAILKCAACKSKAKRQTLGDAICCFSKL